MGWRLIKICDMVVLQVEYVDCQFFVVDCYWVGVCYLVFIGLCLVVEVVMWCVGVDWLVNQWIEDLDYFVIGDQCMWYIDCIVE